ncbi:MAG: LAGLIDADG family homing endonuclease [Candidatus Omnitrophica bacterium]|nr:LAGLIDADG family homing endonuclease [Candidatus Omnitrophota bacterium]
MRTISREVVIDPSETTRRTSIEKPMNVIAAYLQGALGDATYSKIHKTHRISQSNEAWLKRLKRMFKQLGHKSWIYKEGKKRNIYVLETTAKFLSLQFNPETLKSDLAKAAYIRGYFDAEGGLPRSCQARFYIQFSQKNLRSLQRVKNLLEAMNIQCGKIHNPSWKIDSEYWRFFVRAQSYERFIKVIGSLHPRKSKLLCDRRRYSPCLMET